MNEEHDDGGEPMVERLIKQEEELREDGIDQSIDMSMTSRHCKTGLAHNTPDIML